MSVSGDLEKVLIRMRGLIQRSQCEILQRGPDVLKDFEECIERVREMEEIPLNMQDLIEFQREGERICKE